MSRASHQLIFPENNNGTYIRPNSEVDCQLFLLRVIDLRLDRGYTTIQCEQSDFLIRSPRLVQYKQQTFFASQKNSRKRQGQLLQYAHQTRPGPAANDSRSSSSAEDLCVCVCVSVIDCFLLVCVHERPPFLFLVQRPSSAIDNDTTGAIIANLIEQRARTVRDPFQPGMPPPDIKSRRYQKTFLSRDLAVDCLLACVRT